MIPPTQAMRQAMMMRQQMMQGQSDPLLEALGRQKMMGEGLAHTADYKMKMYKLKQKYGGQGGGQGGAPPQPQGPAMPQPGGMQ